MRAGLQITMRTCIGYDCATLARRRGGAGVLGVVHPMEKYQALLLAQFANGAVRTGVRTKVP